MTTDIKPCPMCGSEAQMILIDKLKGTGYLSCKNQSCRMETPVCDSPEKCLAIWDRRTYEA